MISSIISRLVILVFGTLYPAYASYKAVRTKNVKEYVKWMMYWIVFALFTCAETFTDVFCSFWFPFYYEFKVILVLWLLSPATKGSSILYRKFVHPMLTKREQEIDEYIAKAKEQGYHTVLTLGSKGVNYATTVIMQTAIKGGGGLVNQLRRSYSLSDISADMDALAEMNRIKALPEDELDLGDTPLPKDPRLRRSRGFSPRRSASGSGRVEMYFPEVDVNVRQRGTRPRETGIPLSHIRSNEDVSSGYSSAEMLYSGHPPASEAQEPLVRTSSVGSSRVTRTKVARGGATPKRPTAAEDNESWSESEEPDSGTQEECFYDVASASHSEPDNPPPSTQSHVTESDFKSHSPVALECEPKDKQKPVVASEENINSLENVTANSNSGLLEEQSTTSPSSSQEEEKRQLITEPLVNEESHLQEGKSIESECNTLGGNSIVLDDISKDGHTCDKEMPASDTEVPFLDDLKNKESTKSQEINSIPKTVYCNELVLEKNPSSDSVLTQELDDIEFFDTESDVSQNVIAVSAHNGIMPAGLEVHNSLLLIGTDSDSQSSNMVIPIDNEVSFSDENNENVKSPIIDFIPVSVHCEDMDIAENLNKTMLQELDDIEFYDTETDLAQNPTALSENNSATDNQHRDKIAENNIQKPTDDMFKEGRAGRYNKHPAPSPPPKSSPEVLELITEGNKTEGKSHELVPDQKSPSPITRERSRSKTPQCSPNVHKKMVADDKSSYLNHELVVPDQKSPSPETERSGSKSPRSSPNVHKKMVTDDKSSNLNHELVVPDQKSPSPEIERSGSKSPQSSPNGHKKIVADDKSSNLNHELVVPDQKSPSPETERSGSKSPQSSPNVLKKNVADDKSEHESNATVKQVTPTESVNTHNNVTAPYTEKVDIRPSEYYYNQYRAQASPNQPRKETKSKQDSRFFSRILAKPRSQLASFFPFFSSHDVPQPLSDSLTTSLISLGDVRAQERARSSSLTGITPNSSEYLQTPPEIPPRRRTPEQSEAAGKADGTHVNIREMSHSPPRRYASSD